MGLKFNQTRLYENDTFPLPLNFGTGHSATEVRVLIGYNEDVKSVDCVKIDDGLWLIAFKEGDLIGIDSVDYVIQETFADGTRKTTDMIPDPEDSTQEKPLQFVVSAGLRCAMRRAGTGKAIPARNQRCTTNGGRIANAMV